jgi:hypothetical protein
MRYIFVHNNSNWINHEKREEKRKTVKEKERQRNE